MPVATPAAALGLPCPDFTLPDVFGRRRARDEVLDGRANLVVFFCNHCPYAQAVEERLIALHREHVPAGLRTALVCSNDATHYPDDAPDRLRARAEQRDYPFPYLVDESQGTARAFDAACTPDFFLFDGERRLVYRGRLDDNWKRPDQVKRRELHEAIAAVLAAQPVATAQHPSLGCSIKWRQPAD
ncbi:MAG: thioredoxin family protein [Deltaproteobacteria bacterium]|nr:thioredoxin family protein [Deltaproteobacteria bacterium]